MNRRDRESYRIVGGHFRYGIHLLFDSPSRYLTFLRDPIERVISHYAYVGWQSGHEWHHRVAAARLSLEQWVRLGAGGAEDNLQIRRLTTRAPDDVPFGEVTRQMLEEAKYILRERIDLLGITERYDDSIRLVAGRLGWQGPVVAERLNASPCRPAAADLTASARAAIAEHNELDIELYAFAAKLFERRLASSAP
jgi:hypothetical protein